jgi:hypothetical protein
VGLRNRRAASRIDPRRGHRNDGIWYGFSDLDDDCGWHFHLCRRLTKADLFELDHLPGVRAGRVRRLIPGQLGLSGGTKYRECLQYNDVMCNAETLHHVYVFTVAQNRVVGKGRRQTEATRREGELLATYRCGLRALLFNLHRFLRARCWFWPEDALEPTGFEGFRYRLAANIALRFLLGDDSETGGAASHDSLNRL